MYSKNYKGELQLVLKIFRSKFAISIFGVLLCSISLVACSMGNDNAASTTPKTHQTYTFHGPAALDGNHHAGETLQLQWKPQAGSTTSDALPASVSLNVQLIGPFTSADDMQNAIQLSKKNDNTFDHSVVVAASEPIFTDTWSSTSYTSIINFPTKLAPGYYDLFYMAAIRGNKQNSTERKDIMIQING